MNEAAGSSVLEAARKGLRFQTLRGTDRSPGLLARRNRAFGQIWDAPVCTSSAGCRKKASKRCCAVLRRLVPFGCPRKDGSELEKGKAATCWTGWVRVGGLVASESNSARPYDEFLCRWSILSSVAAFYFEATFYVEATFYGELSETKLRIKGRATAADHLLRSKGYGTCRLWLTGTGVASCDV